MNNRRIECTKYPECLDLAAKKNRQEFSCENCQSYSWEDPTDQENVVVRKEEAMEEQVRICTKCHVAKPIDEFGMGRGKDGRRYMCKKCEAAYQRAYKARKKEGAADETQGPVDQVRERVIAKDGVESKAKALADAHWTYIAELLITHGHEDLQEIGFHYKSAMIHGYKHGVADAKENSNPT